MNCNNNIYNMHLEKKKSKKKMIQADILNFVEPSFAAMIAFRLLEYECMNTLSRCHFGLFIFTMQICSRLFEISQMFLLHYNVPIVPQIVTSVL